MAIGPDATGAEKVASLCDSHSLLEADNVLVTEEMSGVAIQIMGS